MSGDWKHILRSCAGVDWSMKVEDGEYKFMASSDITAALDYNKNCYNWNDGYTESRDLQRLATIPAVIGVKWLQEEGWWYQNPEHKDRFLKKLNDPDWRYLRTAEGYVAEGRMI